MIPSRCTAVGWLPSSVSGRGMHVPGRGRPAGASSNARTTTDRRSPPAPVPTQPPCRRPALRPALIRPHQMRGHRQFEAHTAGREHRTHSDRSRFPPLHSSATAHPRPPNEGQSAAWPLGSSHRQPSADEQQPDDHGRRRDVHRLAGKAAHARNDSTQKDGKSVRPEPGSACCAHIHPQHCADADRQSRQRQITTSHRGFPGNRPQRTRMVLSIGAVQHLDVPHLEIQHPRTRQALATPRHMLAARQTHPHHTAAYIDANGSAPCF